MNTRPHWLIIGLLFLIAFGFQSCRSAENEEALEQHVAAIMADIRNGGNRGLEEIESATTIEKAYPYVVQQLNDPTFRVRWEIDSYANQLIKRNPEIGISLLIALSEDKEDSVFRMAMRSLDSLPREQLRQFGGLRLSHVLIDQLANHFTSHSAIEYAMSILTCLPREDESRKLLHRIARMYPKMTVSCDRGSRPVEVSFLTTVSLADLGDKQARKQLYPLLFHATVAQRLLFFETLKYRTARSEILPALNALKDLRPAMLIMSMRDQGDAKTIQVNYEPEPEIDPPSTSYPHFNHLGTGAYILNRVCDVALTALAQHSRIILGFAVSKYPENAGVYTDEQLAIACRKFREYYSH